MQGLKSSEDAWVVKKLRDAGAVLIGKTNMPPMAAGGMQRGLYGRAESPYNLSYLTAAFASGSSNGAATSTTASFAAFGLGSETVSSGRSPASNNGLVCYTPSRGVLSCRGLWGLYGTCDVVVPYARSVEDMREILAVLNEEDPVTSGDFWREQPFVKLPKMERIKAGDHEGERKSLKGRKIGVPKMYIGGDDPKAKPVTTNPAVVELWERARADLEALGATVIETDFPLVTNYEDDSISGQPNNVVGVPSDWNLVERGLLIAKLWDDFLIANADAAHPSLAATDGSLLFPKPPGYVPDMFAEIKNAIPYSALPEIARKNQDISIWEIPGMKEALNALEAQRNRDFEDWLDEKGLDFVVFPANGDVGKADVDANIESARHALLNGVKYSNGNRAVRHLGVPTVSVCMGEMEKEGGDMPINLTFAGKAYEDEKLLKWASAYENQSRNRVPPPLTPVLKMGEGKLTTEELFENVLWLSKRAREMGPYEPRTL